MALSNKNPTFLPCQAETVIYLKSKHVFKIGDGHRKLFVSYLLDSTLEEQISVEQLVEN